MAHRPERTCLGCGKKGEKQEFLRVVRKPDGEVVATTDPKVHGRSTYICRNESCIKIALKKIDKALRRPLTETERESLREILLQELQR